jgi:hypothetical protein
MKNGTVTTHGFIPNLSHKGLDLVAMVEVANMTQRVYDPVIRFGRVVYALPGGGEVLGGLAVEVIK